MRDAIQNLNRQFAFKPKIENASKLRKHKKFVVCGMGGSNIPTSILKTCNPSLDVIAWNDYGLPDVKDIKQRLVIVSSYSGNTEEALDSFAEAKRRRLRRAAITSGGTLLEMVRVEKVPYVNIPSTGIQPRMATGFMLRALMKLIGDNKGLRQSEALFKSLKPDAIEAAGKRLARSLQNKIPVIYASRKNGALAWNWKIKFNETGKIPAFANVLPEANHNEMTGFDVIPATRALSKQFHFIFLEDPKDNPRVQLRMRVTGDLYRARGLASSSITLEDKDIFKKAFSTLALADWTAFHLAMHYCTEAEKVPMVEALKKKLK